MDPNRIFGTLMIILVLGMSNVACRLQDEFNTTNMVYLKNSLRHFLSEWNVNGTIVIHNDQVETNFTKSIIRAIFDSIADIGPTMYVTSDYLNKYAATTSYELEDSKMLVATSNSLVVYIDTGREDVDRILVDMFNVRHPIFYPKVLIVLIVKGPSANLISFLRNVQTAMHQFPAFADLVALEIFQTGPTTDNFVAKIHQFNQFNEAYSVEPLTMKTYYAFPNKLKDTFGVTFYVYYGRERYLQRIERVRRGLPVKSIRAAYAEIIRKLMNVTIREVRRPGQYSQMYLRIVGMTSSAGNYPLIPTPMIDETKECLLIPRITLPREKISLWGFFITICMGFLFIMTIWIAAIVFRIDGRRRHPINTIATMLGLSQSQPPVSLIEKILYVSLVIASTRYTAMFYNELFALGITKEKELSINSFDDLDKSGMHAFVVDGIYDNIIGDKDIPPVLKERIIPYSIKEIRSNNFYDFMKYNNVTIFTEEELGRFWSTRHMRDDFKTATKMSDFCIMTYSSGFLHSSFSIYIERIDEIILRILESGLNNYWMPEYMRDKNSFNSFTPSADKTEKDDSDSTTIHIFKYLFLCYLILDTSLYFYR